MKLKQEENYLKIFLGLFSMALMIYIGTTVLKRVRLDVTEENLYTLSDGTKSILGKLDAPIKLKLYYSKTAANKGTEGLRAFNNYYLYVRELLREYVAHSRNNLSLQLIDPRPDTPEEEDAQVFGLKKFQLTDTESYFFGLVAENESGVEKIIEFFDPNQKEKLEYDLTKLIYTVLNPQKKSIGVLSSLDVVQEDVAPYMAQIMRMQGKNVEGSWNVISMLKELYEVKKLEKDVEKISGVDTLVVIHPKDFSEKTLYAIDQYVLQGGNLLILADPAAVSAQGHAMFGPTSSPDPAFKKLMDKWGVEVPGDTYAGDKYLSGIGKFSPNEPTSRLLALLNCNLDCTREYKDNISSGINNTNFVFPGVVKTNDIEGVVHSPLLSTTNKGNTYRATGYELNSAQALWQKFSEGSKPVIIANKTFGKFKTAFPEGIASEKQKKKSKNKDHLAESKKESAIVLFSDVDFIANQFAFKRTFLGPAVANDNSTLFLNSIEALVGNIDLMSVRSKGRIDRTFDVINEIEFAAQKKTADKVKQINASIARFQQELNELGQKATAGNLALLQNEGIRKKKELAKKIAALKKELRAVKRAGREKVESIGKILQYINTLVVPVLVIIFGFYYNRTRKNKMQVSRLEKKQEEEKMKTHFTEAQA